MLTFFNLEPEFFGVDVNDLSLRMVKLAKKRKAFELVSFNEVGIRQGVIKEGVIQDQEGFVQAIQLALSTVKGKKLNTRHVIVSLPEEKSFAQVIRMPRMEEKELQLAVPFEAENYIPLPIEKVYLDFQAINSQAAVEQKNSQDVLINVLPKNIVDSYVSAFKKAALTPAVLEVESAAIVRALLPAKSVDGSIIFIDFSQTKTSFIIYSGNSIRFTCTIPISSGQLTDAIAKNLQIGFQKAEELKIRHGMVTQKGDKNHDIVASMDPILSELANQIKKYISFYQGHISHEYFDGERAIEKVVLCGGGANLKELTDFLYKKLRIPVELGNPFCNLALPKPGQRRPISEAKALAFTTAIGLALRGVTEHD